MSKLSAFLNPVSVVEEKEVIISNRFLDEKGNQVPFKIRSLTQEEMDGAIKKATKSVKNKRQVTETVDNTALARNIVFLGTVEPDFSAKELCDKYGVLDPALVPGKMLLSGEHARLSEAIMELSGFDDEDVENAAKNS